MTTTVDTKTESNLPAEGSSDRLEYDQCQEAVKKLTEYLSSELVPDEEKQVQQHLSQCRGCFAKFQFEETLLRTIRERAQQIHAPQALRDRILGLLSMNSKG